MMDGKVIEVNIVCADSPVWSGSAKAVTVPALEGGMGILPNHEPVLTVLAKGRVTVTDEQGQRHVFDVSDGFMAFDSNKLTVAVKQSARHNADGEQ